MVRTHSHAEDCSKFAAFLAKLPCTYRSPSDIDVVNNEKGSTAMVRHMPHYLSEFEKAWGFTHMQNDKIAWRSYTAAERLTELAIGMAIELTCAAYTPALRY